MPLCCASRSLSKNGAIEAETRRARIVSILPPSAYNGADAALGHSEPDPPPRYEEATQNALFTGTSDEKSVDSPQEKSGRLQMRVSDEDDESDMTSILSTPSTQVTGITMAHNVTTVRCNWTGQTNSSDSRPPSYFANPETDSARSPSPASDGAGRVLNHPVMGQDWRNWVDGVVGNMAEDTARR